MSEALKVIRSQLSAAGLQVIVQCAEDVVAAVTTETTARPSSTCWGGS